MLNGFRVSDVDIHVREPSDLWQQYIDPAFAEEAPRPITLLDGEMYPRMMVAGSLNTKVAGTNRLIPQVIKKGKEQAQQRFPDFIKMSWSPQAQILGMDQEGIDVAFLYPTEGLKSLANENIRPELALAISQAYNRWLGDFSAHDKHRMIHIAMIPLQNPDGAIQEIRRCTKEYGTKGIFLRGEPLNGRTIDSPVYEQLWSELENLNIAIGLHQATHSLLPSLGTDRFHTRFQCHTLHHPMEHMASLVAIIGSGILDRYPNLRIAFLEAGAGWLPYMLWRFDEQFDQLASIEAPWLKMKPSEYFRRQCWISVEPDEPQMMLLFDNLGENRTVISSDFPHTSHPPGGLKAFSERIDLPRTMVEKTLWDNTMQFYNMNL